MSEPPVSDGEAEHDERQHLRDAPGFQLTVEWPPDDPVYLLGVGRDTYSLYVGSDRAFHFDLEGRLRRASTPGRHYLRGLDGKVLRKTTSKGIPAEKVAEGLDSFPLSSRDVGSIFEDVFGAVSLAVTAFRQWRRSTVAGRADEESLALIWELLSRAALFNPARLQAEEKRFLQVYSPLSILPPDRYGALILQATTGCSYGKCRFCSLYRDVPYHKKSIDEFREHVRGAKSFLGRALSLKSGVFLGEANALELPSEILESLFRVAGEEVPDQVAPKPGRRGGISVFTDVFQGEPKARDELERLRSLGLDRVYIGIESGDDDVLRRLRKPLSQETIRERVGELKAGGLSVGLIFLAGVGGRQHARAHVEGTVRLVEELPLGEQDLIYLSPLYWEKVDEESRLPERLSPLEIDAEERELRLRLRGLGLRVSRYDLKSFIYY